VEKDLASFSFHGYERNRMFYSFLEDSVPIICNQEALPHSWVDLRHVQGKLIWTGLYEILLNLIVHILYDDPYHLRPLLCHATPFCIILKVP
jgi:hypothetical protein